jgi:Abi-like protein
MRNPAINASLQVSLSPERLSKYLTATGGDLNAALALYERNTRLAESFYSPLQSMEICLRNKLAAKLATRYGPNWFQNGVPPLRHDAVQSILDAVTGLQQSRTPITPGGIVAELSFGFWVGLLGPRYDATIWRQSLHSAFRENGAPMRRDRVHGRFNALRRFRNRIAHHEPIFLQNLPDRHAEIIEATSWMCGDTAAWSVFHSRFQIVFAGP